MCVPDKCLVFALKKMVYNYRENSEMSKPHAVRNNNRVFIIFLNKTQRKLHVIWLNFKGEPVIYKTLEPGSALQMFTFEQHPWVFEDSRTGDRMLGNGHEVFYPKQDKRNPNSPKVVLLTCPLISLRQRALQVIRDSIKEIKVEEVFQIPRSLLNDIHELITMKEVALLNYSEYEKFAGY